MKYDNDGAFKNVIFYSEGKYEYRSYNTQAKQYPCNLVQSPDWQLTQSYWIEIQRVLTELLCLEPIPSLR